MVKKLQKLKELNLVQIKLIQYYLNMALQIIFQKYQDMM